MQMEPEKGKKASIYQTAKVLVMGAMIHTRGGISWHPSIRFRLWGQRFDSEAIIDATNFFMYISMRDFQKYIYTSGFATQNLLITSYFCDDH